MPVYRNRRTGYWRMRCRVCTEVFDPPSFGFEMDWSPHDKQKKPLERVCRTCVSFSPKPFTQKELDT